MSFFVTCIYNSSVASIVKNISEIRWILMLMLRFAAVFFHTLKATYGLTHPISETRTNTPLGLNYEFQISDSRILQSLLFYETVCTTE